MNLKKIVKLNVLFKYFLEDMKLFLIIIIYIIIIIVLMRMGIFSSLAMG